MIIYHTTGPKLLELIYPTHLAMLSDSAQDAMTRSLRNSPAAWIAYHADIPLAFAGVIPPTLLSDTAYLWMYTTPSFAEHRLVCLRHSHRLIADALRCYPILVGHCSARSHHWLHWLGATFGEPQGHHIPFRIEAH